jgi:hypothetical protein
MKHQHHNNEEAHQDGEANELRWVAWTLVAGIIIVGWLAWATPANSQSSGYCTTVCDTSGRNCSTYCTSQHKFD